jgi:GT2 family glycosyltransferase
LNVNPNNKLTNNPTYPDGNHRIPDFSCFICDDRLFEKVGEFDENFKPAYFEDTDMRLRAQQTGYKMVSVKSAAINHFGSATMKLDTSTAQSLPPYYRINQQYFIDKHGGTQDELITV